MSFKSKPTRISKKLKGASSSSAFSPPAESSNADESVPTASGFPGAAEAQTRFPGEGIQRQYSRPSAEAIHRIDQLNHVFASLADRVGSIDSMIDPDDLSTVHRARQELAQIIGDLEKLQFNEIDAITTTDLRSGKADAVASRKMLNDEIEALQRQSLSIYNQLGAFIEAVTNNHAQQEQQEKVAQEEARRAAEVSVQEPTPAEAAAVAKLDSRPLTREETTKLLLLLSRAAAAGLVDPDVRKHLKSEICQQKGYLRYIVEQETIQGSLHEITEFTLPKNA